MKAVFRVKALAAAVQAVIPAVGRSSPHPGYKSVKLTFGPITTIAATDGEVSIVRQIPDAQVESEGSALFPPEKLTAILRETTAEEISIDVEDGKAKIKTGSSRFTIPLEVAAEFPESPKFVETGFITVSASDIQKIVARSIFFEETAAGKSYALQGVNFDIKGDLYCITTDSRKMGYVQVPVTKTGDVQIAGIIPSKAMRVIGSLAEDGSIDVAISLNNATFRTPFGIMSTTLVAGRYPDWRRVYPATESRPQIAFVAEMLARSIRQSLITTTEESRGVKFRFSKGTLHLSSSGAGAGESTVELPANYDGELSVELNPDYMLKALKLLEAGTVVNFMPLDKDSAIVMESEDGLRYVQMPINKE